MELDDLKSTWNRAAAPAKTTEELLFMLKENNHPVLKGIRKQLTIEVLGWSFFLGVYYTMFDGGQKPLLINLLLIAGLLFSIVHNLMGYGLAKYLETDLAVKKALAHYLLKLKVYALTSVVSRVFLWTGFILFFTYNVRFTGSKYVLLTVAVTIFAVQLVVLGRIWMMRLKKLSNTTAGFM